MRDLVLKPEFWAAVVQLAWPVVFLVLFLVFRPALTTVLKRENVTMKVAGMELSVSQAARKSGEEIVALQERVARLEERLERAAAAPADVEFEQPLKERPRTGRILWVDDHPSNNAFGIERLEKRGLDVRKELSTDAAMRALLEEEFDIVITDLGRRESGAERPFAGLELIEKMRSGNFRQPVLVFASSRGIRNRERLLRAGATEVTSSMVDVMKFIDNQLAARTSGTPA